MLQIFAATRNPEKVAAVRGLLGGIASVSALPCDLRGENTEPSGPSVAAIAVSKACEVSRRLVDSGLDTLVLATDGGLLVPGMGRDWDPTRTRRFAGNGKAPIQIAAALLDLARGLDGEERRIGWVEALVVAHRGKELARFAAESPPGFLGTKLDNRLVGRSDGFWVPYVWCCPEFGGKLLADLSPEEQAARDDHWSRLGREARAFLATIDRLSETGPGGTSPE